MKALMAAKAHCPEKFEEFREMFQKIGVSRLSVEANGEVTEWGKNR